MLLCYARGALGSGLLAPPKREKSHVCLNVMQQLTEQVQTAEQGKRDEKPRKDQRFLVLTRTPEQMTKCANCCVTTLQQWNIYKNTWKWMAETDPEPNS